jgi:ATP-dependent protease Clp ATPase subunit
MSREQIYLIVKRHLQCIRAGVPSNCHAVIVGPSGSGKTYTIRKALDLYGAKCPVINIDASQLSPPGYKGSSIQDILSKHSKKGLSEAIVYVDEFDKLVTNNKSTHADYMVSLQTAFLCLLDKTNSTNIYVDGSSMSKERDVEGLSTNNITFIFSGVFRDVEKVKRNPMGFNGEAENVMSESAITHQGLIDLGFMKELVYRIPYIIQVKPYSKEELRQILRTHFGYRQATDLFGLHIDEDDMLEFIHKHPAGARSIQIYLGQKDLEHEAKLAEREEEGKIHK